MEFNGSCTIKHTPENKVKCPICKPGVYEPVSEDGKYADVLHQDVIFLQPFETCLWQQDYDNEFIKKRNFFESPGRVSLSSVPEIQNCQPTSINTERDGMVSSFDGTREIATNLKDIDSESELFRLPRNLGYCLYNKNLKINNCAGPSDDKYCRSNYSQDLDNTYLNSSINNDLYNNQLNNNFKDAFITERNQNVTLFRNYSKSKLTTI